MSRAVAFTIALFLAVLPSSKIRAALVQETVDLPVTAADARGGIVRQSIKVTILRDDTRERAPFAIINHGRSTDPVLRRTVTSARMGPVARYLVEKGFVVLVPIRIGYGASGGRDIESSGTCDNKTYTPAYEAAARQSLAVIAHAKSLPYVASDRGIVMGTSFGGTTAIGIAAKQVPGVLAAMNFAGGGGGRPQTYPDDPCGPERMRALFAAYGATARIPTLWLYSENDRFWGRTWPREWFKAFVDRGGKGEFVKLPVYKSDGHPIFTGNPEAWKPAFEAFVERCCAQKLKSVTPSPASAPRIGPEVFTQTLERWANKHKVSRAVIVVRRDGGVVHKGAIGGADPDAPVLLASLSKAITGACAATLIRQRKLGLEWPLSRTLARFFAAHGMPADPRVPRITIAQLLAHRAGFAGATDGEDPSTRSVLNTYLKEHSTREAPKADYLRLMLQQPLLRDPGATFAYSNAGYLLLGAVIEEATGRSYEDYCRDAVLTPAGAYGELDRTWTVMGAYGGWHMRGADYLAFFDTFDTTRAVHGEAIRDWMLEPEGKTFGTAKPPSWYGPGLRLRDQGRGLEYSHTGSWRRQLSPDALGPRNVETSTLAVRMADGTSWFVHSLPLVLDGARNELDRELVRVHPSVQAWK